MNYKNNAFNIRFSKDNNWFGQSDPVNGFCTFTSVVFGVRAFIKIMYRYVTVLQLCTIREIITRYAPPSDNNTTAYIKFVSDRICYGVNDKLDLQHPVDFYYFCMAVAEYESNYKLSPYVFDSAYKLAMFSKSNDMFNV